MKDSEYFNCGLWTYEQRQLDFKDTFEDSDLENCSISIYTCFLAISSYKIFSEPVCILVFVLFFHVNFSLIEHRS
jgi:hypothetical protein